MDRIGHFEVAEVLKGLRVRVHGLIHYRDLEQVTAIDVEGVNVYESDDQLPCYESIVSPDFTDGVEAVQYLEALRQDG